MMIEIPTKQPLLLLLFLALTEGSQWMDQNNVTASSISPTCTPRCYSTQKSTRNLQQPHSWCSCVKNASFYETNLILTHRGISSAEITDDDYFGQVEVAIITAYNNLASDACDNQFRNASSALVDRSTIFETASATPAEFTIRYQISGRCDGCLANQRGRLFDPDSLERETPPPVSSPSSSGSSSRSGKKSSSRSGVFSHRRRNNRQLSLRGHDDNSARRLEDCSCLYKGGPEERDLMEGINEMLQVVSNTTSLVTNLVEAKDLTCSSNVVSFGSIFLVQLDEDASALSGSDVQATVVML